MEGIIMTPVARRFVFLLGLAGFARECAAAR